MYKTLIKQAEHFGIENRLIQCLEETGELQQAICKCIRTQKEVKLKRTQERMKEHGRT